MRKQTKVYARGRKAGVVVLALGFAGTGATYIGALVRAQAAPATRGSAPGLSLAADRLPGLADPIARAERSKATRQGQSVVHAAEPQPRSSRPRATPIRLRTRFGRAGVDRDILAGERETVSGSLKPRLKGRHVLLQVRQQHRWWTVARSLTGARSRYELSYRPTTSGTTAVRVVFAGDSTARPTNMSLGLFNVYHLAVASWYEGGGSLACGGILTSSTMGVANKTLPCGTMVTIRYNGRTVRVPVIDRGPFVPGREFDLTEATKAALGFEGVGDVWTIY